MIKRKTMLAIADINKIVEQKGQVDDLLAKTQRERDLKVDTINKQYEAKIDAILRRQKELEIIIRDTKEYVKNV
jgi:hypothetical protein